ncbi:MAG TPA: hypothetical protein PK472_02720, partial [Pseudomonadota bacterium]|nr:hypothetical protein [Pseudomonadota bacterium]
MTRPQSVPVRRVAGDASLALAVVSLVSGWICADGSGLSLDACRSGGRSPQADSATQARGSSFFIR